MSIERQKYAKDDLVALRQLKDGQVAEIVEIILLQPCALSVGTIVQRVDKHIFALGRGAPDFHPDYFAYPQNRDSNYCLVHILPNGTKLIVENNE